MSLQYSFETFSRGTTVVYKFNNENLYRVMWVIVMRVPRTFFLWEQS